MKYTLLTYFLICCQFTFAQELYFSTMSMRDGLPSNIISDVTQDKYGFTWVATRNGLVRYDGNEYLYFKKNNNQHSLSDNELTEVLSTDKYIWVGSWNGLNRVNVQTLEVERIDLPDTKIRTIENGRNGTIWIGTSQGIIKYNDEETVVFDDKNGLSHKMVRSIYKDKNGNLWVGTNDGLNYLKEGSSKFETIQLIKNKSKNTLVLSIQPDQFSNNLWIGTEMGLFAIDKETFAINECANINQSISNKVIKNIFQDNNATLYLGTDFGLNLYSIKTKTCLRYFHDAQKPYSISNNIINSIYKGKNEELWLATLNGISILNSKEALYNVYELSYQIDDKRTGYQVKSMIVDRNNHLWLATSNGVIRINLKTQKQTHFTVKSPHQHQILMNNTYSILEDRKGNIWIGTVAGINIWHPKQQRMTNITVDNHPELLSNYVGNILESDSGDIWVNTWEGGIFKLKDGILGLEKNQQFEQIKNKRLDSEKFIFVNDKIFTASYNKVFEVDPKTLTTLELPDINKHIENQEVFTLYSSRNNLWIGSSSGLIQYDIHTNEITDHLLKIQKNDNIVSITEDEEGNIWSITNLSIIKYDPLKKISIAYPLSYNLPIKNFNFSCVTKNNNEIYFGGNNGYITFKPDELKEYQNRSSLYLTGLKINNQKVEPRKEIDGRVILKDNFSFTKSVKLNYEERFFTINFTDLNFNNSIKNLFAYRLNGFDENWHTVPKGENQAIFSNVSPGKYTFELKLVDPYGETVTEAVPLGITIERPFLLQNVFIAIYIFLIIGFFYVGFRIYTNRLKLKNKLQISEIRADHAEELDRTKEAYFTNISHELRTPISLILPPLQQIRAKVALDKDSVSLLEIAEKNADRLKKLVNQILDFNKMQNEKLSLKFSKTEAKDFCENVVHLFSHQAIQKNINYQFTSTFESLELWIDKEKMETILFNLLSNAFKFTDDKGEIKVHLSTCTFKGNEGLRILIQDSGIGIPEKDQQHIFERFYQTKNQNRGGTGIGLALVAEFVELHYGSISVESDGHKGTTFTIDLPLGMEHLPLEQIVQDEVDLISTPIRDDLDQKVASYKLTLDDEKSLVLIVDDNKDIVDLLRMSLKDKFNLIIAENGQDALQKAIRIVPQLIISDVMMPVMDGISFTEEIKKNPKTDKIPIILLTAKSLTTQKIEGLNAGADIYLTKPVEIEELTTYAFKLIAKGKTLSASKSDLVGDEGVNPMNNEDTIFVNKVIDFIESNLSNEDLSVEMIADEMSISAKHLTRKLKAITQQTPKDIIKKYRLKKASILLQNKEGNITDIVDQTGFSSLSYFSRVFKSEFKMSPKKYQEKYQKANS
ncbi:hybrid sensor histidine kinase/response regulator transcription factor [Flammeovirga sp. OC4]|uniref:hybrid sensor histidine kinase/response regulator transcription factor n=1 Tax=Flammeovirga sp. OC4 TaxID=1382345 RepID=UPI0009E4E578|nr:hybrid sensor histidine kinase/response regulator transcription factor [Flammeovirga sp. OC4]